MLMALVVLFSSFSYTINSHYCGDILVDAALFAKADACGMEMNHEDDCDDEATTSICVNNDAMHCKDIKQTIDGNDIEFQAYEYEQLPDVYFSLALAYVYTNFDIEKTEAAKETTFYKPPIPKEDFTVLFENFRI